jgi:diguanylate cyclase (GGDEF)-like protein
LVAGSVALLIAALAVYAMRLRSRLDQAERKLCDLTQNFETSTAESRRLSGVDALTGTANRGSFDDVLEKEWARSARARQPLAIIMADIDRFKLHNDTHGHQAGDECLRQVAAVLKRGVLRPADLVARYGGEEFVVILPGANLAGATAVAERMRRDVQALKLAHVLNCQLPAITIAALFFASAFETARGQTGNVMFQRGYCFGGSNPEIPSRG